MKNVISAIIVSYAATLAYAASPEPTQQQLETVSQFLADCAHIDQGVLSYGLMRSNEFASEDMKKAGLIVLSKATDCTSFNLALEGIISQRGR